MAQYFFFTNSASGLHKQILETDVGAGIKQAMESELPWKYVQLDRKQRHTHTHSSTTDFHSCTRVLKSTPHNSR